MRKKRQGVFETNSSSTHSITVSRRNVVVPITKQRIFVETGSFGWESKTYFDIKDILSYIYTAICCVYKKEYKIYTDKIDRVLKENTKIKITWEKPTFDTYFKEDGSEICYFSGEGIDHDENLKEWLQDLFNDDKLLLDTIFSAEIETGNDNDGWTSISSSTFSQVTDDEYFYNKGC